jgi:Ala-tRNA(Pro) deacylase
MAFLAVDAADAPPTVTASHLPGAMALSRGDSSSTFSSARDFAQARRNFPYLHIANPPIARWIALALFVLRLLEEPEEEDAMPVRPTVQEFLRVADLEYTVLPHDRAHTARQEAAAALIPVSNWAKVVIAFADGEPVQAVVPADCDVDFERLAALIGVPHVRMATEDEIEWLYPDCETGAMPPLGPLYRQLVFVDRRLTAHEDIAFNAGTFDDAVVMRVRDFLVLAKPVVGNFARAEARQA